MALRLADNEWGFAVAENNPFRIFRILQDIAKESVGEESVIDLSRGDPGYGFTPSDRGRRFVSYLLFLDTVFNNTRQRVVTDFSKSDQWLSIKDQVEKATKDFYTPEIAKTLLDDFEFFLHEVTEMGKQQGLDYSPYKVFYELFKYSMVSGGSYHDPLGEAVIRVIVAWWHKKAISTPIDYRDLIFVSGASHAIGDLFKMLGADGIGFLLPHSKAMITSPVYAPYNSILESRGIEVFSLEIDSFTGKMAPHAYEEMINYPHDIKVILLIDPNNPTGFSMSEESLRYSSFFKDKKTMIDICPERTIRIHSRSKIERSTGLRFGDVMVAKEGQKYIMENILRNYVKSGTTWNELFMAAKGPGGILGEFQHTTFVPGPAQILGAAHIVLGKEERGVYRESVGNNMSIFSQILELPHQGNMYYIIFDLNEVKGAVKQHIPIEEKLVQLAKRGVVYIPSNRFFSEKDRQASDRRNTVRASVVNTSADNIRKAAEITREYLRS
ncbi:MAG: hypothetical protein UT55_C0087G0006 [Candidatus Peregrinibacteria bacterium GW2011_GWE2_39_6]|nr:MAG: hypothetical protein UT55_C0087G0006 [Candidatus Peregrinibacteria bacterium GW2011_GWE2_39_6]